MSSTPADLLVAPCSHAAARYAVEHWHYSGRLPTNKIARYGVWESGSFIGAVVFGDGANAGMFQPYGLHHTEGCELVRVALRDHRSPVTRVVAVAVRVLVARSPGLRVIVSFADPEQGHVGLIYQAGNWIYTGRTMAADEFIVRGVRMHGRALRATRKGHRKGGLPAPNVLEWTRKVLDPCARPVPGSSKHRYLYPLDRAMRRQIEPLRQPYPKAVASSPAAEVSM